MKFGHPQNFFPAFLVVLVVLITATSPHRQIGVTPNPFHPPPAKDKPPFPLPEHVQEQQEFTCGMLQTTTKSPPAGFHTSNQKKGKEEENLLNLGFPTQFRVSLKLMPRQLHPLLKTLTRIR